MPGSEQPFQAALDLPEPKAHAVVASLVAVIESYASEAVAALVAHSAEMGWRLSGAGLVVGRVADPARISNDYIRARAEEERLFRRVLEKALRRAGLTVEVIPQRRLYANASDRLKRPEGYLRTEFAALRNPLGGPWRAEDKGALLAAWMQLPASSMQ